jgi:hypothetical protein
MPTPTVFTSMASLPVASHPVASLPFTSHNATITGKFEEIIVLSSDEDDLNINEMTTEEKEQRVAEDLTMTPSSSFNGNSSPSYNGNFSSNSLHAEDELSIIKEALKEALAEISSLKARVTDDSELIDDLRFAVEEAKWRPTVLLL